ncbi:hypothetical protein EOD08_14810 [Mesorhizobium sp. M6A.T.Ca.TU.002.02.2.1]|nr:hypothetical protein EOD08_14810 [Mesorhizobium sp. M6A.T.Ca.TU.002.02.2.1]
MNAMSFEELTLERIGLQAYAHYKSGEKANNKAIDHAKSAGLYLAEAKRRLFETKEMSWPQFLKTHCKDAFKQHRADQLIAIVEGRTTIEEVRSNTAERVRKSRAAKSVLRNTEKAIDQRLKFQPPPEPDERDAVLARIMAKLAKLSIEQLHDMERIILTHSTSRPRRHRNGSLMEACPRTAVLRGYFAEATVNPTKGPAWNTPQKPSTAPQVKSSRPR